MRINKEKMLSFCKGGKIEVALRFSLTKVNSEAANNFFYRLIFAADKLFFWGQRLLKTRWQQTMTFLTKPSLKLELKEEYGGSSRG